MSRDHGVSPEAGSPTVGWYRHASCGPIAASWWKPTRQAVPQTSVTSWSGSPKLKVPSTQMYVYRKYTEYVTYVLEILVKSDVYSNVRTREIYRVRHIRIGNIS